MKRIALLYGGMSAEHEISLLSARNIFNSLDKSKYDPVLIGIDKRGVWRLQQIPKDDESGMETSGLPLNPEGEEVVLLPGSGGVLHARDGAIPDIQLDCVFPVLHGPFGEDGTVQGLLKLSGVAFVGAGVLGSAIGMDKEIMKRVLITHKIPIGRFITLYRHEGYPDFENVKNNLGMPVFVKPANLGSSVGISKVSEASEWQKAVDLAFQFDTKVVVEENIEGQEIECAVMGNEEPFASPPGEVVATHSFYSYDAKYIDEKGADLIIPARLDEDVADRVRTMAVQTFQALNCSGLARVDFFVTPTNEVLVNEINTMPGFTKISMYPKMMENKGLNYLEQVDELIRLALVRHATISSLKTSYD